jgi:Na+-translocating ferredoxin:NAD+ oxidoreductase RnfD subunit
METVMPKIIRKTSPYLRRPKADVTRMMRDVAIALLPVTIFAIYKFEMAAVMIILVSILSMMAAEYIYYQIVDKPSYQVKENDIISIRGKGRVHIKEILNLTKKGRLNINIVVEK